MMADASRQFDCSLAGLKSCSKAREIDLGMRHHTEICDLDAAGPMLFCEFHAAAEKMVGAGHPSACIFAVTQSAERSCLILHRARSPRKIECRLMFTKTFLEFAERETQISAQMMKAGEFKRQIAGFGQCFRFVHLIESIMELIDDAHPCRQT